MTLEDVLARILADGEPRSADELHAAVRSKVRNQLTGHDWDVRAVAGWTVHDLVARLLPDRG